MAQPPELVIYLGLALIVLGVLPIIWNTFRSIRVWLFLNSVIPTDARKNVSFTIEPVSGIVRVGLDSLELRWAGLFRAKKTSTRRGTWSRYSLKWLFGVDSGGLVENELSLDPRAIRDIDCRLIGCSWMSLPQAGISLKKVRGSAQQIIVDASLRFDFRGVPCDRATFTFLALALGVDPYRNALDDSLDELFVRDGVARLYNTDGCILRIEKTGKTSLDAEICGRAWFDQRRALAWFGIMVLEGEDDDDDDNISNHKQSASYRPLACDSSQVTQTFTSVPCVADIKSSFEELVAADISLESALEWACYAEEIFFSSRSSTHGTETLDEHIRLLPVPQTVLKARDEALMELDKLGDDVLRSYLDLAFPTRPDLAIQLHQSVRNALDDKTAVLIDIDDHEAKPRRTADCLGTIKHIAFDYCPEHSVFAEIGALASPNAQTPRPAFYLSSNRPSNGLDQAVIDEGTGMEGTLRVVAARIWLALSVIQLWPRLEWETRMKADGQMVSRPGHDVLSRLLECVATKEQKVYIG